MSLRFISAAHFSFVFTRIIIDKCLLLAEMMTKFNKDLYARMRGKKDKPPVCLRD